jgi:3D (Asp-Asp-Asp) domain-containing protein
MAEYREKRETEKPTQEVTTVQKEETTADIADIAVITEKLQAMKLQAMSAEKTETTTKAEELQSLGTFRLTAYCPCSKCCNEETGITATGTKATEGRTVAVDPKIIPYGTQLMINGSLYVAEDCGGAINNKTIDIYFNSHAEALSFGVQYAEVYANNVSV